MSRYDLSHALDQDGTYFEDDPRGLVLVQLNEGGLCETTVRVVDILEWLAENRPELLRAALAG